jgi:hypothetical protein
MVAAIALSGTSAAISVLQPIRAWAQASDGRSPGPAMVRMARLLFPHDALTDDVYAEVLGAALSATSADGSFAALLDEAGAELDTHSGGDFLAASEAARIAAMEAIETDTAFQAIRINVLMGVYQHPAGGHRLRRAVVQGWWVSQ